MSEQESLDIGAPTQRDLCRSVLDDLIEGCQVISPEYRYLYVNDSVARHGKTTRAALLGRTMMECYPGIEESEMFGVLRTCMEHRSPSSMENEFEFPDGSKGWFELRFEPVPEGVVVLSVDITERKRTELTLRRTLRTLTILSRCNQTLVRATDERGFIEDVCNLMVDAGGYLSAQIALHPGHRDSPRLVGRGRPDNGEPETDRARTELSLDIRSGNSDIGTLTVVSEEEDPFDTDERVLLGEIALDLGYGIDTIRARIEHASTEEQLVASQRLEAVGRLAGGVAHDFNNLLSVILTYADFAAEQLHEADPARADIERIHEAGDRAAALTGQLLAFSRKQIMEPQVTSMNDVIGGIESMLHRLLGEDIDIEVHPADDLGNVMADPRQLEQVIMNLAVNSRDAMPNGGKLTIDTDNIELDDDYAREHLAVEPGPYVRLSITDTGVGMSEEVRNQVFEPFFTTKEQGKGTGLGLSMAYGIVKQSGGNIWVYSELGQGTTFKIYLPRVDAPVVARKLARKPAPAKGDETILLVEDEPAVRKAAARILHSAGYRVLSAANGGEALLLSEKHEGRIDLLLTDVVMPEMSGRDLAERLKQLSPDLKILFTSGYTDNAIVHHGVLDAGTSFIGKPFSAATLTDKLREVLDEDE